MDSLNKPIHLPQLERSSLWTLRLLCSLFEWGLSTASLCLWEKGADSGGLVGFQTRLEVHRELPASSRLASPLLVSSMVPRFIVSNGFTASSAHKVQRNSWQPGQTRLVHEYDQTTHSCRWGSVGSGALWIFIYLKGQIFKSNSTWARGCLGRKKSCGGGDRLNSGAHNLRPEPLTRHLVCLHYHTTKVQVWELVLKEQLSPIFGEHVLSIHSFHV